MNLEAFKHLQQVGTTAPMLVMPDFTQPFTIDVLSQNNRSIEYFSKALADSSLSTWVYEKELMALVLPIQHWRPYLQGKKFLGYTDQKSSKFLQEQWITTQNQQKANPEQNQSLAAPPKKFV